jgi:hypothetical protein
MSSEPKNATCLFENKNYKDNNCKDACRSCKSLWPPNSESFWTSAFAFFLLYLYAKNGNAKINIWFGNKGNPWYKHKENVSFKDLKSGHVSVEPESLMNVWPELKNRLDLTGISPDLFLMVGDDTKYEYYIIENKVSTSACLRKNQTDSYSVLVTQLNEIGKTAKYYVLQSIGCDSKFFLQTLELQKVLNDKFGIILWEDILRQMIATDFKIGSFNPKDNGWIKFTAAINGDVADYDGYDPLQGGIF